MINDFAKWILLYSTYFLAFPIAIAFYRYRFITKELRYMLMYLGLSFLTETIMTIMTKSGIRNNLFVVHIYTILEFNIIALFYYTYFNGFYHRYLVPAIMGLFTVFAIINSLFFQKLIEFNSYSRGLECILVIMLCLMCFYQMLIELSTKTPEKKPVFWINAGFLFYFAGNIVLFILSNVVLKENKDFNYLSWGLHALLNTILQIFIGIGLWFSPHQK